MSWSGVSTWTGMGKSLREHPQENQLFLFHGSDLGAKYSKRSLSPLKSSSLLLQVPRAEEYQEKVQKMGLMWSWRDPPAHPSVPKSPKCPFPQEPQTLPGAAHPWGFQTFCSHSQGRNSPTAAPGGADAAQNQGLYLSRNGNYCDRNRAGAKAWQLLLQEPTGLTKSFHSAKKKTFFCF